MEGAAAKYCSCHLPDLVVSTAATTAAVVITCQCAIGLAAIGLPVAAQELSPRFQRVRRRHGGSSSRWWVKVIDGQKNKQPWPQSRKGNTFFAHTLTLFCPHFPARVTRQPEHLIATLLQETSSWHYHRTKRALRRQKQLRKISRSKFADCSAMGCV